MKVAWSPQVTSVWAKSAAETEDSWLPLPQHLTDAAGVAEWLWDNWLADGVRELINQALPESARDGRTLLAWLAGTHDVGKASPAFVCQRDDLAERCRRHGLPVVYDADRVKAPHSAVGYLAIRDWLERTYQADRRIAGTYADISAGHHGRWPAPADVLGLPARPLLVGGEEWVAVRDELLTGMAQLTGADRLLPMWVGAPLSATVRMMLTGVVVVADWIASDESRFVFDDSRVDRARVLDALTDLDLPAPWRPHEWRDADEALSARFPHLAPHSPRPLQRACFDAARAQDGSCLMLLEAPMGGGKTEAALLAAEELALRDGAGGVFVGLPTMATSDAMFGRLLRWVETHDGRQSVTLAHGHAHLNDEFRCVRERTRLGGIEADGSAQATQAVAEANAWLAGRHRGLLANVVVGTVDQALRAGLLAKYVVLRHLALASKVVVIDEVHAADEYMREFLTVALEWFGRYGTSVILLSATLPSRQRAALVAAYATGAGRSSATPPASPPANSCRERPYPLLTVVDAAGAREVEVPDSSDSVELTVQPIADDLATLIAEVGPLIAAGACVGIVRNTVRRAQQTAAALRIAFPTIEVLQIHARFLAAERMQREDRLRALLGPPADGTARPNGILVVGTQVLEQSLDVDFDVMVSDLAPADLLLQRAGRVHRHQRTARPDGARSPRLLVTGVQEAVDGSPALDPGGVAVYSRSRLLRAWIALGLGQGGVTISLPGSIRSLVETAYDPDLLAPDLLAGPLRAADEDWEAQLAESRSRAGGLLLKPPVRPDGRLPQGIVEVSEGVGVGVRDGDGGIEVFVCYRDDSGLLHVMPGDHEHADAVLPGALGTPDWAQAMALARTSLKLPGVMCKPWCVDAVVAALEADGLASWQLHPLLRGQLVLVFDTDLAARIAGFELTYDLNDGLLLGRGD